MNQTTNATSHSHPNFGAVCRVGIEVILTPHFRTFVVTEASTKLHTSGSIARIRLSRWREHILRVQCVHTL